MACLPVFYINIGVVFGAIDYPWMSLTEYGEISYTLNLFPGF